MYGRNLGNKNWFPLILVQLVFPRDLTLRHSTAWSVFQMYSVTALPNSVALLTPRKEYSWLPITRTSRYLEPKSIPPGFSSYIYCNFTLGNSNLPLTQSSFCFPSVDFYVILPSISQTMFCAFKTLKSREKKSNGVRNIEFWISHWRVIGIL